MTNKSELLAGFAELPASAVPAIERGPLLRPGQVWKQYFPGVGQTSWYMKILPSLERVTIEGIEFVTFRSVKAKIDSAPAYKGAE